MPEKLARALVYLSGRTDLIVAILMLVAIIMIIIPLPTWLVDGLIAINITASMLVLLVVFYIARPVEFSSFPSVLLIATLFRLAITITTPFSHSSISLIALFVISALTHSIIVSPTSPISLS